MIRAMSKHGLQGPKVATRDRQSRATFSRRTPRRPRRAKHAPQQHPADHRYRLLPSAMSATARVRHRAKLRKVRSDFSTNYGRGG